MSIIILNGQCLYDAHSAVPGHCILSFPISTDVATVLNVTYQIGAVPAGSVVTFSNGSSTAVANIPVSPSPRTVQVDYPASFIGSIPVGSIFKVSCTVIDTNNAGWGPVAVQPGSVWVDAQTDAHYLVNALVSSALHEGVIGAAVAAGKATPAQYQQAQAARAAAHQAVRDQVLS